MRWTAILSVAAALVCLSSAQICPDGWVDLGGSSGPVCFHFKRSDSNYDGARSYCLALGADLAKLTGDMHMNIIQYINDEPALVDKAFWIGGTDRATEGTWKWEVDQSTIPLGPPHWYACTDQPSHGDKKNCLCLFTPDFYFHSCTCEYNYYAICRL